MIAAPAGMLRGLLWASLAVLIAATYPVITRLGVTRQAMTPLELATLRFVVAAVVLSPVLVAMLRRLDRRGWTEAALLTLCQGTPLATLIAGGLALAPAAHGSALTLGLMPAITILLRSAGGERFAPRALVGATLIAAGAACLAGLDMQAGGGSLLGHGMFVLAAVMGSTYFLRLRRSGFTATEGAAIVAGLSAVGGVLALALIGGLGRLAQVAPGDLLLQAVFQGVLVGVAAMVALNQAIVLLGPTAATVCLSLVPATAALLALPVLGEASSLGEWLAFAAMVLGAALAAACERRAVTPQSGASNSPGRPERRPAWIKHLKLVLRLADGRAGAA
ncbi:DMT family transporter [Pararoseomonas indoligenes]|uniref:DMT family transporter n=1 Tax=Roseomonas indoligenes TaxID=2820811 RepID=A0A940S335_9PROT|nr:DMT family transporter [Pararoseomonas indoligenes]MBP0491816.1 DMT family transporter [Pararoseomonas indoligenes]